MKRVYIIVLLIVLIASGFLLVEKFLLQDNKGNKLSDQSLPKPDDFVQIKRDIQNGIYFDFENLSKNYYLQPDFYPSYKPSTTHDYSRWGIHGYGAYPGEISYNINNFKKGQFVDVYTFVKAGEDIETFQGIKFGLSLVNGDNNSDNSFESHVSPDSIMLSPTFPQRTEYTVDNRTYDWAYKLKLTVVANKDISPGKYEFKLKVLPPDGDTSKLYYSDIQKINLKWYKCPEGNKQNCDDNTVELRKKVYINGGQFQADKFFDFIINVGKE